MARIVPTLKRSPLVRAAVALALLVCAGYALWVAGVGLLEGEIPRMGGGSRSPRTFLRAEEPLTYWLHLLCWAGGGIAMLSMLTRGLIRRGLAG